jgi:hypothetical protein
LAEKCGLQIQKTTDVNENFAIGRKIDGQWSGAGKPTIISNGTDRRDGGSRRRINSIVGGITRIIQTRTIGTTKDTGTSKITG